ncbi:MAG: ABC transporter substrate-binding protein [Candidatus Odinarchaeota archaeon]
MEKKKTLSIAIIIISVGSAFGLGMLTLSLINLSNASPNTYLFIDSMNREVYVPNNPQRIVSMAPSITETIFALEAEEKLVGVTDYCNYPVEATNITSIGGFSTPNLEVMSSLNPDLIIAASWNAEKVAQLESQGYPIVIILADTLDEIIENMGKIGNLVNVRQNGIDIMENMLFDMELITNKTTTLNYSQIVDCYFEIWETPMVVGEKSYINDMILKAGAINIFGNINLEYPTISHEAIIDGDPDVIFITEHSAPWYSQAVCDRTGYNVVDACIHNRVYECFDDIYLRPGPRIIDALENMTTYLYPMLFT